MRLLVKFKGKPDAGNPLVRFDEGEGSTLPTLPGSVRGGKPFSAAMNGTIIPSRDFRRMGIFALDWTKGCEVWKMRKSFDTENDKEDAFQWNKSHRK